MILTAKVRWKAASDKEGASIKNNDIYTLLPVTSFSGRYNIIGSRWISKIKATTPRRDASLS